MAGREVEVKDVLILVLVEDGLGALILKQIAIELDSLNPCFSGGWSRSLLLFSILSNKSTTVLILVLVEDGLGAYVGWPR